MCGICGFIGNKKDNDIIIKNMIQAIHHRGPDSEGTYLTESASLGFCRLSIIDLEDGSQPMKNETQDMALVFNGEIYNYQTLRSELKTSGHQFSTHSDSETLLHGFESYGTDLLDHLRGMFAFAIWDEKKQQLFAARDFFGIKPFYYAIIDGCFVFASEIKSILKFPGCPKVLNTEALEQYLSFQYSVLDETFFKGIYKLPAGCFLTYDKNGLKIHRYFDPILRPESGKSDAQITASLESVMLDSVNCHMVSDVEIGAFLSSGVDSSFIAATFSGQKAFSVGFSEGQGEYNEICPACTLADKLELEHHTKLISAEEYWQAIPKVMYHLDEPSGDASAIALYFVAEEASRYVKVVTSGEGSDELFGGYTIYMEPDALKWMNWMPDRLRHTLGHLAQKIPFQIKGRGYLIRAGKDLEERFIGNAHIFTTAERKKLLRCNTEALSTRQFLSKQYKKVKRLKDIDKMQYIDLTTWLPGDILQKADKMSMAHSLELRVPFLDREVFQTARTLPKHAKVRCGQTKYLFRKMAAEYLPHQTSEKKKLGFPVPIRVWLKEDPWYSRVKEAFSGAAARTYFHQGMLLKLLEDHRRGICDNSRKIWTVYAFLIWYHVFFEDCP